MNIGDKIDLDAIGCRGFDQDELYRALMKGARNTVWSWGAHAWTKHKDQWLRFKSNGHHHKGHVYITVAADDTFTIYYTTVRGKIVDKHEGIYVDMLVQTIDNRIERIGEYVR